MSLVGLVPNTPNIIFQTKYFGDALNRYVRQNFSVNLNKLSFNPCQLKTKKTEMKLLISYQLQKNVEFLMQSIIIIHLYLLYIFF